MQACAAPCSLLSLAPAPNSQPPPRYQSRCCSATIALCRPVLQACVASSSLLSCAAAPVLRSRGGRCATAHASLRRSCASLRRTCASLQRTSASHRRTLGMLLGCCCTLQVHAAGGRSALQRAVGGCGILHVTPAPLPIEGLWGCRLAAAALTLCRPVPQAGAVPCSLQ